MSSPMIAGKSFREKKGLRPVAASEIEEHAAGSRRHGPDQAVPPHYYKVLRARRAAGREVRRDSFIISHQASQGRVKGRTGSKGRRHPPPGFVNAVDIP